MEKNDFKDVGPDKGHKDAISAVDAQIGTYKDPVATMPATEIQGPAAALPKATDPSPFKLGPLVKGS
jgi:hypothetical protein